MAKSQRQSLVYLLTSVLACLPAVAQTYTECDPLEEECDPNKALGSTVSIDFTEGYSDMFTVASKPNRVDYSPEGMHFTIAQSGDNPTIDSDFYIMFGRVEVVLQAAPGTGIVSSFVLQSDDLDEIDLEWLGGDTAQFQTNFFSKGDTTTYDRGQFHDVKVPQAMFHNYTIDWTDSHLTWMLDGQVVRVLESSTPAGYPQTPMMIRIGSWAGGDPSNSPGTIEWAGGATDYTEGPFVFTVKSIFVQDYSSGTEYQYGDQSGTWTSIQAIDGKVNGEPGDDTKATDDISVAAISVASAVAEEAETIIHSPSFAADMASSTSEAIEVAAADLIDDGVISTPKQQSSPSPTMVTSSRHGDQRATETTTTKWWPPVSPPSWWNPPASTTAWWKPAASTFAEETSSTEQTIWASSQTPDSHSFRQFAERDDQLSNRNNKMRRADTVENAASVGRVAPSVMQLAVLGFGTAAMII